MSNRNAPAADHNPLSPFTGPLLRYGREAMSELETQTHRWLDLGASHTAAASSEGGRLAATVLPLDGGTRNPAGHMGGLCAVFVHEPADTTPQSGEIIGKLFKLTGAELRVLLGLVGGATPAQIAERYGISIATVKTHLARLFEKTGTSRQSELVQTTLLALPPVKT